MNHRRTDPEDTPVLIALAEKTAVFQPHEIQALNEVLDDYHATNVGYGHECITLLDADTIVGFAYFAPAAMTIGTWYLYWIAVEHALQGKGLGKRMLDTVEAKIIEGQGNILLIETSSLPHYELTRRFYLKHGYEQEAVIRDFYAIGDDMVVYRKKLRP